MLNFPILSVYLFSLLITPPQAPIKVLLFFCIVFILRLYCLYVGHTAEISSLNNLNVIAQLSSTLKFCPQLTMFC
jgi:hypothetical protein